VRWGVDEISTSFALLTVRVMSEAAEDPRAALVADSAFMIAHDRALESARDDALFNDQWAARMNPARGRHLAKLFAASGAGAAFKLWPDFHVSWTAVRTKFLDDLVSSWGAGEEELQLVNLGAGLDTRMYRLELPAIRRAFEVDVERINGLKSKLYEELGMVVSRGTECHFVDCDLTVSGLLESQLATAGFDSNIPTVFLAEGIIMYLGDAQQSFVESVCALAAIGSRFVLNFMDIPAPGVLSRSHIEKTLIENGWVVTSVNQFGDEALNFGRFDTQKYEPSPGFSFLVAEKRQ
jgi:methyltransferase (TIGR00027 family)